MTSSDFEINYRHKGKTQKIEVRGPHDYCTFFEVYCRRDYWAGTQEMVIVDIGSNIGVTARYFIENGARFVYLYEPDTDNLALLKKNLVDFTDRYQLTEKAVSISTGSGFFESEKTGRYGHLVENVNQQDFEAENISLVEFVGIEEVLEAALSRFKLIDLLKIDIEGLELAVVEAIPVSQLRKIQRIQYEIWPEGIIELLPRA